MLPLPLTQPKYRAECSRRVVVMYSTAGFSSLLLLAVLYLSNTPVGGLPDNTTQPAGLSGGDNAASDTNPVVVTYSPPTNVLSGNNTSSGANSTNTTPPLRPTGGDVLESSTSRIPDTISGVNGSYSRTDQPLKNPTTDNNPPTDPTSRSSPDTQRAVGRANEEKGPEKTENNVDVGINQLTQDLAKAAQRPAQHPEKTAPAVSPTVTNSDALHPVITDPSTNERKHLDSISVKLLRAEYSRLTVEDSSSRALLNHTKLGAYNVDYHYKNRSIFFTAFDRIVRQEVVGRVVLAGLPQAVVTVGVEGSLSLAVDWLHDRLYWLSHRHHTVESAAVDGTDRTTLVDTLKDTAFPNNLAVDPYSRFLFIVSNQTIYRSGLNGKGLTKLPVQGVRCLTLDLEGQRIIYSGKRGDYTTGRQVLAACDYQGSHCSDLPLARGWNDIYSLDHFRGTLYFAHYSGLQSEDSTWSADLSKTPLEPKWRGSAQGLLGIRVYHPQKQQGPSSKP